MKDSSVKVQAQPLSWSLFPRPARVSMAAGAFHLLILFFVYLLTNLSTL